jgi:diaminopimelate epimerase
MRFTKMQGAGNDYVYVNCFVEPMPLQPDALAREIADRHYGVGGDGLILICPSEKAAAQMRMFNADGSESEMCGNGIRCTAKYVYDHGIAITPKLDIETGRGVLSVDLEIVDGLVDRVRVDMGEPILTPEQIPTSLRAADSDSSPVVQQPLPGFSDSAAAWFSKAGLDPRGTCVSMGNPHVVLYCRDVAAVPLETIGPILENHPAFPRRINVHFVEVHDEGEVTMRTWERGSGITLACGTGASAVCVAGVLEGRTSRKILAHLPGGDLELEWNQADGHVYMTGPAVEVFSGEWNPREAAVAR